MKNNPRHSPEWQRFELDRRKLFGLAGASVSAVAVASASIHAAAETYATGKGSTPDPSTAEIVVDIILTWGATHAFGIVGDGINPLIEALRRRRREIAFIGVRHEEAAAFMASGIAKHGGRLGVCVATTGPGAIHLLNGLFDAKLDGSPVLALTGSTFHDMEGMRYPQSVSTIRLMQDVALFNEQVSGPAHALHVVDRACRAALDARGVAHLTIAKDVQTLRLSEDHPSVQFRRSPLASSWTRPDSAPSTPQLAAAADLLNAGRRVAILAGQGCLSARPELERLADTLAAPVAKAYLGKAVLPDDHPLTTGGIGHLGTRPSFQAMQQCDTLLILGSTMPWTDYYPQPGQARTIQLDRVGDRIGLRTAVEIGLVGDMQATLAELQPLLRRQLDRRFLTEIQTQMRDWNALLRQVERTQKSPRLRPQSVVRVLSDLAPDQAMFSLDCGCNTQFAARHITIRAGQGWTGSGTLVSMASGLPLAIAGAFAHPDRMSLAVVGDGGLAMLMAELSTAVLHRLNVKILVLNNDSLAEVKFEQHDIGNPDYGCGLGHIDFAAYARALGATGFRCATPTEVVPAIRAALATPGPVIIDAIVDPDEPAAAPMNLHI